MAKTKRSNNYVEHSFYCIRCGNKGIPLRRNSGHQHAQSHRKKLYCPYCKMEVNHVECKNDEDVYNFKLDFEEGVFINEVEDSFACIRPAGQR